MGAKQVDGMLRTQFEDNKVIIQLLLVEDIIPTNRDSEIWSWFPMWFIWSGKERNISLENGSATFFLYLPTLSSEKPEKFRTGESLKWVPVPYRCSNPSSPMRHLWTELKITCSAQRGTSLSPEALESGWGWSKALFFGGRLTHS